MDESPRWITGYRSDGLTPEELRVLYGISPETLNEVKYLLALRSLAKALREMKD